MVRARLFCWFAYERIAISVPLMASARSLSLVRSGTSAEVAFRAFWQAGSRLRRLAEVRFAASGLSPAQWRVLRALHEHADAGRRSVRATDLCCELLLTKATVSGILNRLLRMGLVSRAPVKLDQRARAVTLTPAGRRIVASILHDHPAWMRGLMAGLSRAEQQTLTRTLSKLCRWLDPLVQKTGFAVPNPAPGATARRRFARSIEA